MDMYIKKKTDKKKTAAFISQRSKIVSPCTGLGGGTNESKL